MAERKVKGGEFLECPSCPNDAHFQLCGIERTKVDPEGKVPSLWNCSMRCLHCQTMMTFVARGHFYDQFLKSLAPTMKDHVVKTGKAIYESDNCKEPGLDRERRYD